MADTPKPPKPSLPPAGIKHHFFSTIPGMLAALAALITAMVSLVNSCSTANRALLDKMDKTVQTCQAEVATERAARAAAIDNVNVRESEMKTRTQDNRDLAFEYYRRLEARVESMEPLAKREKH